MELVLAEFKIEIVKSRIDKDFGGRTSKLSKFVGRDKSNKSAKIRKILTEIILQTNVKFYQILLKLMWFASLSRRNFAIFPFRVLKPNFVLFFKIIQKSFINNKNLV
jgi:hypothetical protein